MFCQVELAERITLSLQLKPYPTSCNLKARFGRGHVAFDSIGQTPPLWPLSKKLSAQRCRVNNRILCIHRHGTQSSIMCLMVTEATRRFINPLVSFIFNSVERFASFLTSKVLLGEPVYLLMTRQCWYCWVISYQWQRQSDLILII